MATSTDDTRPARRLPRNVRILGWASLLNDVASEAIYPLLPQFLVDLGGNRAWLGVVEGSAESVASLLKLASGRWSDRHGARKGLIIVGYALAGLTRPLFGLATHVWQVAGLRVVDRVGNGLRTAPRDALIAESTEEAARGRAFGYHRAMDHLGAAIGPLLAALFLWCLPGRMRWFMLLTARVDRGGMAVLCRRVWVVRFGDHHVACLGTAPALCGVLCTDGTRGKETCRELRRGPPVGAGIWLVPRDSRSRQPAFELAVRVAV